MITNDIYDILKRISLLNRDNGEVFTVKHRLNRIDALLADSDYAYRQEGDLFHFYSIQPVEKLERLIVVSSHVDCHKDISRCYSKDLGDLLHGTYDNSITNGAIVYQMLEGNLPENVAVAFTGDEEYEMGGAILLSEYLYSLKIPFVIIVLDVTDEGYEDCFFTIENDLWGDEIGRIVSNIAVESGMKWRFVPYMLDDVPRYIPLNRVLCHESEEDETWTYDQYGIEAFSLCIPTRGEMHNDKGLYVKKDALEGYVEFLGKIIKGIHEAWV